jgi:Fic family protein
MNPKDFGASLNGRLIKHPTGYWAFLPNPLPDSFTLTSKVSTALSLADRKVGELKGLCYRLQDPYSLSGAYVVREAEKSSHIEGTQSTAAELYLFEVEPDVATKTDVQEIKNYVNALKYALDRRQTLPVSLRLLREAHAILLKGVRGQDKTPGEFRTSQNWIGGSNPENALYVPPPVNEMNEALDLLEKFWYRPDPDRIPPLIEMAMVHYQFEAVHPYQDGNGRMGRQLITLLCMERGILDYPLLYLSAYLEKHRDSYFDVLLAVSQHGAWEEWLMFFLKGVAEQSEDAAKRASRILDLDAKYRNLDLSQNALRVIGLLQTNPFVTSSIIEEKLAVSNPTANKIIQQLTDHAILRSYPPKRERSQRYVAPEILDAYTKEL